jgi:PAS domain S-box-containing protein
MNEIKPVVNSEHNADKNAEFNALFFCVQDAVIFTDRLEQIIMVNPTFIEMFHYQLQEVMGKKIAFISPEIDVNSEHHHQEVNIQQKNGRILFTEVWINQVTNNQGDPTGFILIIRNITDKRLLNETLQQQSLMLREQADLLEFAEDCILVRDLDNNIIFCNQSTVNIYGYEKLDILGNNYYDLLHPVFNQPLAEIEEHLLINGQWEGELTHQCSDGKNIVLSSKWLLQKNKSNQPIFILETNKNITQQKQTEAALKETESILSSFFNSANMMMGVVEIIKDDILHISDNTAAAKFFNLTPELMENKLESELGITLEKRQEWINYYQQSFREKRPIYFEYSQNYGKQLCWFQATVCPISASIESKNWFAYIIEDISNRKQIEAKLKQSQERLQLALDSTEDALWDWDIKSGKIYFSPRWFEMLGYQNQELEPVFDTWINLLHPDDKEIAFNTLQIHLSGKTFIYELENRLKHKNGNWVWILGRGKVVERDENGQAIRMVGTNIDIDEHRQAVEALRKSEARLRLALLAAKMGIWDWNLLTDQITYSEQFANIFGLEKWHLHSCYTDFLNYIHPEDKPYFNECLENSLIRGKEYNLEFRIITPTGELRWIASQGKIYWDSQGKPVRMLGVSMNITEKKQAEILLKQQLQKTLLLEQITQEIRSSLDAKQILQTTAIEVGKALKVNRCLIHTYSYVDSATIPIVVEYLEPGNMSILGLEIPMEGNIHAQKVLQQDRAVVSNDVYTDPLLIWAKDFCEHIDLKSMIAVRTSYNGQPNGIIGVHQCENFRNWNIDEIELLEVVAAQVGIALEQANLLDKEINQSKELTIKNFALEQAKRQAEIANNAKSEFLAMMSHEIRTPMNAVIGMTGLLLDTKLSSEQREFVDTIRNSGDALLTLINDILDFSKIESCQLELEENNFELGLCVEESLDLLLPLAATKGLELAYIIADNTPINIVGDMTRLRQILVNLISNAIKFTEQGQVVISVQGHPDDNKKIIFSVKDTGIGIPEDRINRLFKPFSQVDSSINRKYGGTGLGLAISKRLTEIMGGEMWLESEVGIGTTFYFTIKVEIVPTSAVFNLHTVQTNLIGKKLLIVDHNLANRHIIVQQVQTWGMEVSATEQIDRALDWLKNGNIFDVALINRELLSDEKNNLVQGIKLLPRAKDLPIVLLISSSIKTIDEPEFKKLFSGFLTKPIKLLKLHNLLINILAKKSVFLPVESPIVSKFNQDLAKKIPLRILLVEDVAVNQKVATQMLQRLGYRADIANNGQEALESLHRQAYDLVFMDVQMPIMDGLEATRKIREKWGKSGYPWIIAMTAHARESDRQDCLKAGMNDYITKPIRVEAIVKALTKLGDKSQPEKLMINSVETEANTSPIDQKIWQNLIELAGDDVEEFLTEIVDNYLQDSPERLQAIIDAIAIENAEDLEKAAHALASSSISIGANNLGQICREVEFSARDGQIMSEKMTEIEAEFMRVKSALESR